MRVCVCLFVCAWVCVRECVCVHVCVCVCALARSVLLLDKYCYFSPYSFYNNYTVWHPIQNLLTIWSFPAVFGPYQPSTGFLSIVEGRRWWGIIRCFFSKRCFEFRIKKLPQPLEQLLKSLPLVNSLEVKTFSECLAIFLKIQRLSASQMFEVIYLFCL